MIWTIAGELYPSRYRSKGMGASTARYSLHSASVLIYADIRYSNWLWNFLLAFFTPFIVSDIDFRYGYVFAGCNVIGGLLVYFFVIEGQNRTLEEIDTMYIEKVPPWKSSKWVAPPPEEIANIRARAGTADVPENGMSSKTDDVDAAPLQSSDQTNGNEKVDI